MESYFTFETPISNFRRLIEQDFSDKFKIILDSSSKEKNFIEISRNEARLISKKINDLCMIDPTIDQYEFPLIYNDLKLEKEEINFFLDILILSARERVKIPKKRQSRFAMIRFLLGEGNSIDQYSIQNIEEAISLLNTEMNDSAIEYLGKHFLKLLENGETKLLNDQILYSIIDQYFEKEYNIHNNNEVKQIFSKMKDQEESMFVIHFILQSQISKPGEISKEMIEYFTTHLNDEIVYNELPRITLFLQQILHSIIKKTRKIDKKLKGNIIECNFKGEELSGIISYLKERFGDDVGSNSALILKGSGYQNPTCSLTNLIKYDTNNINEAYCNCYNGQKPATESEASIEFDFCERRVNLESYTMRSCKNGPNVSCKAKSWRIVGSNDHENWSVLDRQIDCAELNGKYKQHRFECNKNDGYYRYIRYIQEDSWNTTYCKYAIQYTCIELFGSILEPFA